MSLVAEEKKLILPGVTAREDLQLDVGLGWRMWWFGGMCGV